LDWRNKIEFVVEKDGVFETIFIKWIKGFTPKGRTRIIGHMYVSFDKNIPYVEEVLIDEYARGNGLGYNLYRFVIKKYGSLQTSYHYASPSARRIWRKLVKKYRYEHEFFETKLTVFLD